MKYGVDIGKVRCILTAINSLLGYLLSYYLQGVASSGVDLGRVDRGEHPLQKIRWETEALLFPNI